MRLQKKEQDTNGKNETRTTKDNEAWKEIKYRGFKIVTNTEERFKETLGDFGLKLKNSELVYADGFKLLNLADNLFLRYQEIRISRDRWKAKYMELKNDK